LTFQKEVISQSHNLFRMSSFLIQSLVLYLMYYNAVVGMLSTGNKHYQATNFQLAVVSLWFHCYNLHPLKILSPNAILIFYRKTLST